MNIDLHIERLVIEGFALSGAEGAAVQLALEQELARLLSATPSTSPLVRSGATPSVRGGEIQAPTLSKPAHLGVQIAGALYSSIGART